MKEHPILFSGDMVRAILAGRKTQTRRVIVPQPPEGAHWDDAARLFSLRGSQLGVMRRCPYGQAGDRLWVRETWACRSDVDGKVNPGKARRYTMYRADETGDPRDVMNWHNYGGRWRTPRFMPRWASRLLLDVVSIRIERLCQITDDDARREGAPVSFRDPDTGWQVATMANGNARFWFSIVWDAINRKRGYGWLENPWVWVVEFNRISEDADARPASPSERRLTVPT